MGEGALGMIRGFTGIAFLVLLMTTQPGCLLAAGAAAGAGTVAYVSGDLEADLDATPDQVIDATRRAAEALKLRTEYAHGSAVDGRAKLRTAANKEISVKVESRSRQTSHISIRVGTFGDDSLSNQVLAEIRNQLASGQEE
jgi:hypothetical protein